MFSSKDSAFSDDATIDKLEALRWWAWDEEKIKRNIPAVQSGDLAALERTDGRHDHGEV